MAIVEDLACLIYLISCPSERPRSSIFQRCNAASNRNTCSVSVIDPGLGTILNPSTRRTVNQSARAVSGGAGVRLGAVRYRPVTAGR